MISYRECASTPLPTSSPPRYRERVLEILRARGDRVAADYEAMMSFDPSLIDLPARFALMDEAGGPNYRQVLVMGHTQAEHEDGDVTTSRSSR